MKRRKSNLDKSIKMLTDTSNIQHLDSYDVENLLVSEAMTRMANPQLAAALKASSGNKNALATPVNDFRAPVSAAQFDLLITRRSANIALTLPVVLFGCLDFESDFIEMMSQFMPDGVTYTVARSTVNRKDLRFTFTLGAAVDIIDISCNQTPYVNLLRGSQTSLVKMQENKLQISDVTKQAQFSQTIHLFDRSQFGRNADDKFTPNSYKTDLQNQNDIRTIKAVIDIDPERALLIPVIAAGALGSEFIYTINTFIQKFDKISSAKGF